MEKPYSTSGASVPLAVSIGEPAGIGVDIILKIWSDFVSQKLTKVPPLFLICDPKHLATRATLLGISVRFENVDESTNWESRRTSEKLAVWPLISNLKGLPAHPHNQDAAGVVEAISTAVELVQSGIARGVVTLPINKKSLYDSGFDYPGHTEYLGALAKKWPSANSMTMPVMMLAGPELKTVPVTIHIPLKDVSKMLTTRLIIDTVAVVERDLRERFGIAKPRIAIAGLNPHAGEQGAMGLEDKLVVAPAIEALKARDVDCFGPLPADTMFHPAAREKYDVAICMYHDQALIPAKALAFDHSVNVTLGLPFVRTSPDHGTAFDIAGTNKANITSTLAALQMADEMTAQ